MHEKLNITILTDASSWMNRYNIKLTTALSKLGHNVRCISSKENLERGDIAFFLSCFEIIKNKYLSLNKHNIVVHASDLPKGKGWSPITWQILEGKNEIPLTLFEAVEAVDAGDYYIKDVLHLDGTELIDEWQDKLGNKIVDMCLHFINNYNTITGTPQSGQESFYKKRKPENSELDINKTIKEQFNLLRVVDNKNYPAFFYYEGIKYRISIEKSKQNETK